MGCDLCNFNKEKYFFTEKLQFLLMPVNVQLKKTQINETAVRQIWHIPRGYCC